MSFSPSNAKMKRARDPKESTDKQDKQHGEKETEEKNQQDNNKCSEHQVVKKYKTELHDEDKEEEEDGEEEYQNINYHQWVEPLNVNINKEYLYYYVDARRNRQPFNNKLVCFLPKSYVQFMDQEKLWRPEFPKWLMETEKKMLTEWTGEEKRSMWQYLSEKGCVTFHLWFSHGCPKSEDWKDEMERFQISNATVEHFSRIKYILFEKVKIYPVIPTNSILFRGTRNNEWGYIFYKKENFKGEKENFSKANVGDEIIVTRPLSTSWSIHCALHWAINCLLVFELKNNTGGVVNLQALGNRSSPSGQWAECEVLLLPNIKCKVSRIQKNRVFEVFSQTRPSTSVEDRKIDVIYVDII